MGNEILRAAYSLSRYSFNNGRIAGCGFKLATKMPDVFIAQLILPISKIY
jgi:hypothetical protein